MKLYTVCLLVALACVAVTPAPAPQQGVNVSASTSGPLAQLYDLAVALPSTFISSAQNAMQGIPLVNFFPAALQTGIAVGKNFAEGMDHTLLGLSGGRGRTGPFAAWFNPQGMSSAQSNGGQVGGQIAAGQTNTFNEFSNLVNRLNPLNYLSAIAQQNGQRPGVQINPFGTMGNALNNLNPLNYLQGAAFQFPGQQNPNGNNPLTTLTNGVAQTLNQLNPAVLAQYLYALQQNTQSTNSASNAAPNSIPNSSNPVLTTGPGNVPTSVSASVSAPIPAPPLAPVPAPATVSVRAQHEEVPKPENSLPA